MPNRFRPRPTINFCRTPEGLSGECSDVRKCMWLMFNVEKLRQSVCLRNLVVPGVCCPSATIPLPVAPQLPQPQPQSPQPVSLSPVGSVMQPSFSQQSTSIAPPNTSKKPIPTLKPTSLIKPVKDSSAPIKLSTDRPIFHSMKTTTAPASIKRPVHSWLQEVPYAPISGHSLSGQSVDGNDLYNKSTSEGRGETFEC